MVYTCSRITAHTPNSECEMGSESQYAEKMMLVLERGEMG